MTQEELFKKLIAHCKEYGFVFPSSEIYDGLAAVYDYGQNGVELKNNIKRYWWDSMVKLHENIVGIDAAIFMHPQYVGGFGSCRRVQRPADRQQGFEEALPCRRADRRLARQAGREDREGGGEGPQAFRRDFRRSHSTARLRPASPRRPPERDEMHKRFVEAQNSGDLGELRQIIVDCEIVCPISGTRNWTEVRQFNLMFSTQMGSTAEGANTDLPPSRNGAGHLREFPERAENRTHETAVRYRADRQGVPQRDRRPSVHLPHARVRADGDAVLRAPRRGDEVVAGMEGDPYGMAPRAGLRRRPLPFPRP